VLSLNLSKCSFNILSIPLGKEGNIPYGLFQTLCLFNQKHLGHSKNKFTELNDARETFFVDRLGQITTQRGNVEHTITIYKKGNMKMPFATSFLRVHKTSRTIYVGASDIHFYSREKSGRRIMQALVDEAKQLGIKEFGAHNYRIEISPANRRLRKYYETFGFEGLLFRFKMRMKIPKKPVQPNH
jgi:hypothetical protein